MKGIATALGLLLLCHASLQAARVALVRVTEIYAGLPESASIIKDTETETKKILEDPRAADVRGILKEMETLRARLSDEKAKLPPEEARKLAREYELKRMQAQTLQKEFETFRAERQKEIDRVMIKRMHDSLKRIWDTTRKIAKERGYDLVLDSSGKTNTKLNFVLYAKNPDDITGTVVAALKDTPAQP